MILAAILIVFAGIGSYFLFSKDQEKELQAKSVSIEYGEQVKLDSSLFLATDEIDAKQVSIESPLISTSAKYTYNPSTKTVVTKGKDILDPGTYPITLVYKDQKVETKLIVKDDVSVEFIEFPKQINVEQNAIDFDLSLYFLAIAPQNVTIEAPSIDISAVGEQDVTIKAKSEGGQSVSQSVRVNVISYEQVEEGTTLSSMINGQLPLSQTTWDLLNSGEQNSIKIADVPAQITSILKQAKEGTLNYKISYKEPTGKTLFDPKTFKPNASAVKPNQKSTIQDTEPKTPIYYQETVDYQQPEISGSSESEIIEIPVEEEEPVEEEPTPEESTTPEEPENSEETGQEESGEEEEPTPGEPQETEPEETIEQEPISEE